MNFLWWYWFDKQLARPLSRRERRKKHRAHCQPQLETLESRDVPSITVHPDYLIKVNPTTEKPYGSSGPTGYTPAQIEQAYGINQVSYTGVGTTIAIVDAYSDPKITTDLAAFDSTFGIAAPSKFTIVNETGGTTLPQSSTSWAGEISLDVEWAHAIAPAANILLVEANNASLSNLLTAVKYAAKQSGVVAVSMSWGGSESSNEATYDSDFVPTSANPDVVFVNSSGDSGAPASYPSVSPNVLSVGGTTLNLNGSGTYLSESAWGNSTGSSGGGISAYETQPSYQKGIVTQSTTKRTDPDVSFDADPNTGFPVYQTYGNSASAPWLQYGGTSDAAPQWAALIARADQGRKAAAESDLTNAELMPMLYDAPSADFHDITTGTTLGNPEYSAKTGYDLATGIGTPVANLLISTLIGSSPPLSPPPPPATPVLEISAIPSASDGTQESFTVKAYIGTTLDSAYSGVVELTSSDTRAVFYSGGSAITSSPAEVSIAGGSGTFSVMFETVGSESITATDISNSGTTGTETGISVTPGDPTQLVFVGEPSSANVGTAINPVVTVEEKDQFGNVVTNDNSSQVTLALSASTNSSGATLANAGPVTVADGVATFTGLSVSAAGTGYTLTASEQISTTEGGGSITSAAPSSAFTISTVSTGPSNVIENFQNGLNNYYYWGYSYPFVETTPAAAHPGTATDGLLDEGDGNWYFREDSAAVVNPGDTISAWVDFSGAANGRAYLGFGTTQNGLDSVVLAPNTNQLIIQNNAGFSSFTNLAASAQTYSANKWYFVQVQWGTSGAVVANLYASNGTTLLNSVSIPASEGDPIAGTFAFRATGSNKFFSTVSDTPGVNNFGRPALLSSSGASELTFGAPVSSLASSSNPGFTSTGFSSGTYGLSWQTFGFSPYESNPFSQETSSSSLLWYASQLQSFPGEESGFFFL